MSEDLHKDQAADASAGRTVLTKDRVFQAEDGESEWLDLTRWWGGGCYVHNPSIKVKEELRADKAARPRVLSGWYDSPQHLNIYSHTAAAHPEWFLLNRDGESVVSHDQNFDIYEFIEG